MILNRQSRIAVALKPLREFAVVLRGELRLGQRDFNVCLVDDATIMRMNGQFRGKRLPTDVLSFPWSEGRAGRRASGDAELRHFLGDIVISVETARRNARGEGHSLRNEIRWLILHGVLHLMGYNHEMDSGQMTSRELRLRASLGLDRQAGLRRGSVRV